MRESRTYGFVRGAHSDMRPYRDPYSRRRILPFSLDGYLSWMSPSTLPLEAAIRRFTKPDLYSIQIDSF
jgi:hypothetical protein